MGDIKAVLYTNKKKMHLEDISKNLQMVELTESKQLSQSKNIIKA